MTEQDLHRLAHSLLGKPVSALEPEETNVLIDIRDRLTTSQDIADVADERSTVGEKLADRVAAIGGSWSFIISFALVLIGWMILNTGILGHLHLAFDPYPYIFLNLMLSMLAAVQAPIIMMSQNRQAAKDRLGASLDYEVNLRAELEVMRIHQKLDQEVMDRLDRISARQEELALQLAQLNTAKS